MAGFRTFATGEVLTAANVNNFLMGQSVMRFADADARTAALGTDVVEGMLTYNLATDQLEVFDGTNFVVAAPEPPAPPAGIGSNVVQHVRTTIFTTTSTSFVAIPDFEVTLTPSSATSKVLIFLALTGGVEGGVGDGNTEQRHRLMRGSTPIGVSAMTFGLNTTGQFRSSSGMTAFLDEPETTSPVVYSAQVLAGNSSFVSVINRARSGGALAISTLTAIEVAL